MCPDFWSFWNTATSEPPQHSSETLLNHIGGFLKCGVPKSPWVSILKWSNFGWFGGTPHDLRTSELVSESFRMCPPSAGGKEKEYQLPFWAAFPMTSRREIKTYFSRISEDLGNLFVFHRTIIHHFFPQKHGSYLKLYIFLSLGHWTFNPTPVGTLNTPQIDGFWHARFPFLEWGLPLTVRLHTACAIQESQFHQWLL